MADKKTEVKTEEVKKPKKENPFRVNDNKNPFAVESERELWTVESVLKEFEQTVRDAPGKDKEFMSMSEAEASAEAYRRNNTNESAQEMYAAANGQR